MACSLRKNASEHAMGASVVVAAGWVSGAERPADPTLPADERAEGAEMRGKERDRVGASTESAKRANSVARWGGAIGARGCRMRRARATVLEYDIWRGAFATGPKTEMMERR
jgi:hypothetical protein